MIKKLLRLEGLVFFFTALSFYSLLQGNWILFILLLFTPDIFMIGYLKDKKLGAAVYNIGHTYMLGILLVIIGNFILQNDLVVQIGIILFAHVALDRCLGFGLKYPSAFKDTHLQKV